MKNILHFTRIIILLLCAQSGYAQIELTPLQVCDPDNDGFAMVDLTQKLDEILDGDNPNEYSITFHETLSNSESGVNVIEIPYSYYSEQPFTYTIYFRKDNLNDGTYEIGLFQVNILPTPIIGQPVTLFNTSGEFDLTVNEALINTDSNISIAYYTSMQNAINGTNAIVNLANYTVSENSTIWVVVTNAEGCTAMTSFNLIVDSDSIVNIPDTAFKTKLLQANTANNTAQNNFGQNIKIDINEDGEIQYSEALSVYRLYVGNSGINDLTGIEAFVNLRVFDCSFNNLTQLDFSNNINLDVFWAHVNPITHVNIKSGTAMNPNNVNSGSWMEMWANLPSYVYICADENEIAVIAPYLNYWEDTVGQVISSYCTYYPSGDYNTISGTMLYNYDNLGCAGNYISNYVKVIIDSEDEASATFTNLNGQYEFFTQEGTYTLTPQIENLDYFTITPASQTITFDDNNNNVEIVDFCISPNGIHNDLEVVVTPINPARPGFEATYKIVFRNKGNQVVSEEYGVTFFFNQHLMTFIEATVTPDTQADGGLSWNYEDLMPFESREILITMAINPPTHPEYPVNIDDVLVFTGNIMSPIEEENIQDNIYILNQVVVGAYDPNDITCLEGELVNPVNIGEELHYLIRFENTGNYAAENVVVVMDIDNEKYNIDSLQILNTSHNAEAKIKNNALEVFFNTIQLESGGHGNILLAIESKESLQQGDSVQSKADIYFDYNYPVITNDAVTLFDTSLSIDDNPHSIALKYYPNPTQDYFNISSNEKIQKIDLYDISGRLIRTSVVNDFETTQEVMSLRSGTYILKIKTDKGEVIGRMIKK
jgi:hypothetical protein